MKNQSHILKQAICEQIAIEENIISLIEEKISEIEDANFTDAKSLLLQVSIILDAHYGSLNNLLSSLELGEVGYQENNTKEKAKSLSKTLAGEEDRLLVSRILREVYSALNLITISSTQLNTIGLALDSEEVAGIALRHIEILAPLVVKIGKLVPEVIARELSTDTNPIDPSVALTALKNTKLAWKKA